MAMRAIFSAGWASAGSDPFAGARSDQSARDWPTISCRAAGSIGLTTYMSNPAPARARGPRAAVARQGDEPDVAAQTLADLPGHGVAVQPRQSDVHDRDVGD